MPIPEDILKQMKCCLSDDGHIVHEPVLLNCGANACIKCVNDLTITKIKCCSCNGTHEKNDLLNAPKNKFVESFTLSFLPDLFHDLNAKLKTTDELLKGFNLLYFIVIL
jgi:hypothetical protein